MLLRLDENDDPSPEEEAPAEMLTHQRRQRIRAPLGNLMVADLQITLRH
jgi:hypothetical protein